MQGFLAAPILIQLHAIAAIAALVLGAVQFLRPKGTGPHRLIGWFYVLAMAFVAGSSFFIHTICQAGGFSVIHLLSAVTLIALPRLVILARRHRIAAHRRLAIMLYVFALLLAGAFTLVPGRLMHDVVFGTHLTAFSCHEGST